jgi:hypothetical protein
LDAVGGDDTTDALRNRVATKGWVIVAKRLRGEVARKI